MPLILAALGLLALPLMAVAEEPLLAGIGLVLSLCLGALFGGWMRLRVDADGLLWSFGLFGLLRGRWRWDEIRELRLEKGERGQGARLKGKNWSIGSGAETALWLGDGAKKELRISSEHAQRLHDHLRMRLEARRNGQPR